MSKYSFPNAHANDYEAGRSDGCETNPYSRTAGRTGEALAAYIAGFEAGRADMDQYLDEQE